MAKSYQRECMHCKELFDPNSQNRWHQRFCIKPECRQASRADSRRRWSIKPENQHHFRGSENVENVRRWRKANPGYWKRAKKPESTLQDLVPSQQRAVQGETGRNGAGKGLPGPAFPTPDFGIEHTSVFGLDD